MKQFALRHKRLAIAGVAVVCVLVLAVGLSEAASRKTITVTLDDAGFSPRLVTVQPGQKVMWRSAGQKPHWPASNSHPTHTLYPTAEKGCLGSTLDACRLLHDGETFSFVFETPGSWGLHDHLNPGSTMVVEVANVRSGWMGQLQILFNKLFRKKTPVEVPTPEALRSLTYGEQSMAVERLAADNPKAAWELIKAAFIVDGTVTQNVHEFAHVIGNASYRKSGIEGVAMCDTSFAYGCYHGVAEAAITDRGEQAVGEIEAACAAALSTDQVTSCYHGIGHGTAGIYSLNLTPALLACDKLKPDNRTYCYDGVFMEQATALGAQSIDQAQPWNVCGQLDAKYHMACGRYQPSRLQALGLNLKEVIQLCSPAPSNTLAEHCFRASGFAAASASHTSIETMQAMCTAAEQADGTDWCLIGAASELVFQAYPNWQVSAPALCSGIHTVQLKQECQTTVQAVSQREGRS